MDVEPSNTTWLNETRLHIETTLASVSYAERMIRLADQYRREGNHATANAALMMAWNIRENTDDAMAILADLAPEHAALLGQSERQRLATGLNSAYENLNRLGREHGATADLEDERYDQDADWYKFCFEVGLTAHLAETIATRTESQPPTEDNIEIAKDAVGKCYQAAQESMEHARNNEPPADAPFPQTRQQCMEQALNDCAKLAQLDQQLQEKLKAAEREADNSPGRCHLCGIAVRAEDVRAHAQSCVWAAFQRKFANNYFDSRHPGNGTILIWVRGDEVRQWMMLAVRADTSLRQLDQFLRDLWLECCGHMSYFEIGGTRYGARVRSSGGTRLVGADMAEPDERHMMSTVKEKVRRGERFRHEYDYDYDYSTSLDLECVAVLPAPYDHLPDLIDPPEPAEGHTDDFITILARNLPLESCFTCGEPARWCYYANPYTRIPRELGSFTWLPPFFCDACAPRNVTLLALRNSPRAGTRCYDNAHDQPVPPSQPPLN